MMMHENINEMTKKELIEYAKNTDKLYFEMLGKSNELIDKFYKSETAFTTVIQCYERKIKRDEETIEVLNDHIGSLQEKIELMHLDLANQIHWRLKLEEELKHGKKTDKK